MPTTQCSYRHIFRTAEESVSKMFTIYWAKGRWWWRKWGSLLKEITAWTDGCWVEVKTLTAEYMTSFLWFNGWVALFMCLRISRTRTPSKRQNNKGAEPNMGLNILLIPTLRFSLPWVSGLKRGKERTLVEHLLCALCYFTEFWLLLPIYSEKAEA